MAGLVSCGAGSEERSFCSFCGKIWYISHREFRLTAVVTLIPPDRCGCGSGSDDPAQEVDFECVSGTLLPGPGLGRSFGWGWSASRVPPQRRQRLEPASMCCLSCLRERERERERESHGPRGIHDGSNYTLLGMLVTKAGWCRRRGGPDDWQQCQVAPGAGQIITVAPWSN